jgi:hypothetical protein
MVLRSRPGLTPQALRPSLEVSKKRILIFLVDSRVGLPIALYSFRWSTDFSSPLRSTVANFGVRVYVSIVAGGSVTISIII